MYLTNYTLQSDYEFETAEELQSYLEEHENDEISVSGAFDIETTLEYLNLSDEERSKVDLMLEHLGEHYSDDLSAYLDEYDNLFIIKVEDATSLYEIAMRMK